MAEKREILAEDLRRLADDLKDLVVTLTTDPKEQQRKERRWGILQVALSAVFTLAARRVLVKAWCVLTGEAPPAAQPAAGQQPEAARETATAPQHR
jgi:hypothetical protein